VTVLVDEAQWAWRGRLWAHLVSDRSLDELHAAAAAIGVRRVAFQGDHYDVDTLHRERALAARAEPVGSRELVRRLRAAGLRLAPARRPGPWAQLRTLAWPPDPSDLGSLAAALPGHVAPAVRSLAAVATPGGGEAVLLGRFGELAVLVRLPGLLVVEVPDGVRCTVDGTDTVLELYVPLPTAGPAARSVGWCAVEAS